MINIEQTENNLEQLLDTINGDPYKFRIRKFPGKLDELGKPMNCLQVVVTFKSLDFEESDNKFVKQCVVQESKALWSIRIYSINLREYRKVTNLGVQIVELLRGKRVLALSDTTPNQGISPLCVTEFKFVKAEDGFCYRFDITLASNFTDQYTVER